MNPPLSYETFVARNDGYISGDIQAKLRGLRVLVAGCGIGSSFAELAVRMGGERLTLADGDTVSETNLNRQFFSLSDVGQPKVSALAARLRGINPQAQIKEFNQYLNEKDLPALVAEADIVFDTIDFLDLSAIVALHDACRRQNKPVITALSIGWGGGVMLFPAGGACSFRSLFGLPETGSVAHIHYADAFGKVIERLATKLPPDVVAAVQKALVVMQDGKPCPASQIAPGSFSVAALAGTLIYRLMAGLPVNPAPELLVVDMPTALTLPGIDLS